MPVNNYDCFRCTGLRQVECQDLFAKVVSNEQARIALAQLESDKDQDDTEPHSTTLLMQGHAVRQEILTKLHAELIATTGCLLTRNALETKFNIMIGK